MLSLTPLVTTDYVTRPHWFARWLYKRLNRNAEFNVPHGFKLTLVDIEFRENATERSMAEFQRIVTLMQVGTTLGASAAICAAMFCSKWLWHEAGKSDSFDAALTVSTLLAAIILLSLGWIKCLEQTMFIVEWNDWNLRNKATPGTPH